MSDEKTDAQDDTREQSGEKDADNGDGGGTRNASGDKKNDQKDSGNRDSSDGMSANSDQGGKDEQDKDDKNKDDKNKDEGGKSDGDNDGDGDDEDDVIKVARTPTSPALLSRLQHSREYNQARGLGAGGTGAATFHVQRLTALALIPLTVWFAVSMVRLSTAPRLVALHWLAWPVNAAIMALFIVIALRHAVIGVQIILEDYVHGEGLRAACVLAVKAIALVLGVAAVAALIHLSI